MENEDLLEEDVGDEEPPNKANDAVSIMSLEVHI